jgi:hypothetical protein
VASMGAHEIAERGLIACLVAHGSWGQFHACTKRSIGLGPPARYTLTGVEASTLDLGRLRNEHVSCSTDYGKPWAHGRFQWLAGQRSRRRIFHPSAPEIA